MEIPGANADGDKISQGKNKTIPLEITILLMNKIDVMSPERPLFTPQEFIKLVEDFSPYGVKPVYTVGSQINGRTGKEEPMIISRANTCSFVSDTADAISQVGEVLRKQYPELYRDAPQRDKRVSYVSGKESPLYESDKQYIKDVIRWAKGTDYPAHTNIPPPEEMKGISQSGSSLPEYKDDSALPEKEDTKKSIAHQNEVKELADKEIKKSDTEASLLPPTKEVVPPSAEPVLQASTKIETADASREGAISRIPLEAAICLMNGAVHAALNGGIDDMKISQYEAFIKQVVPNEFHRRYEVIIPDPEKVARGEAKSKAVYSDQPHLAMWEVLEKAGEKLKKLCPDLYEDAPKYVPASVIAKPEDNEAEYSRELQSWMAGAGKKYGTELTITSGKGKTI